MKRFIAIALILVFACAKFSEELTAKYSIEVLNEGQEGTQPSKGQNVEMHYEGTLVDGTVFDSSYKRNSPLPLRIGTGQVIKCWDEVGLALNLEDKVKVLCPSATAYGSRGVGPIPANSDLYFIIERVK